MPRPLINGLTALAATFALLLLLRLTWSPDPTQSLFFRAGQLEQAGQTERALRAYALISDQHPDSFYAPRALLRQGDLLAARGARSGDQTTLKDAVTAYARLATTYPRDALVSESLRDAGQISLDNLKDFAGARNFYAQLLEKSSAKSDDAALATLQLGHIALAEGDGPHAQGLLLRVLRLWPTLSERGAEAQFTLGVAYETLFKNKDWAMRAYYATIARYPNSLWASNARQKLGLIAYSGALGKPPARRVLIQIDALPDNAGADGSLWSALRLILAAHGAEASETTLGGWSLAPFYAGFDPQNPARVVKSSLDGWENVVANAGLRFSVQSGGKNAAQALRQLQDEIDAARAPLVYFETKGAKTWALCVGYDSERGEVMLQSRGARFDTLSAKSFGEYWGAKSSFGQSWTLISLVPTDQKTRPKPSLTPMPVPTDSAVAGPSTKAISGAATSGANAIPSEYAAPGSQNAPAFVWELPEISLQNGDNRARARAATILARGRSGQVLLGAAGLEQLAIELQRIARARPAAPPGIEVPAATPLASETATPLTAPPDETAPSGTENGASEDLSGNAASDGESPYAPDATPTSTPLPAPRFELRRTPLRDDEARARALLGFLGAAAQNWAQNRREAAAWCDEASKRSKNLGWQRARDALRQSADALESAISLAPASLTSPLGSGDRAQIAEAAHQIERAAAAERLATRALLS